jgi:multicomponent Na+:H+ antiporter subunit E
VFRAISLFATLLVFWLLLSGHYEPFFIIVGCATGLAVVWLAKRMDVMDHEGHPVHLGPSALWYWPWLVKEIVKSGWSVTRVILHPRLPIEPTLVRFRPSQQSTVGLVAHANSITLTPGTISIEVEPGEFLVHALTREGAEGLVSGGDMDRRVARFEGKARQRPEGTG